PVLYAHLPGEDRPHGADYELLEDADLLTISWTGILKLGSAEAGAIMKKVRRGMPARAQSAAVSIGAAVPAAAPMARRLVILVHGIRTRAEWQGRLRRLFESIPGTTAVSAGYGYFDVLRFLCPFWTRQKPIAVVEGKIRDTLDIHRGKFDELTIMAHSFGTYVVGDILRRN